jgi:predicted HTH domain antitoxin
MATVPVNVPDNLLALLQQSRLPGRTRDDRVRVALAIHLFQEGLISAGKAAELAGESRIAFESLLDDLGIPAVRYGEAMYEQDLEGLDAAKRRADEQ